MLEIQLEAISIALQAYYKKNEKEQQSHNIDNHSEEYQKMAQEIKSGFDQKYKRDWHCIVGDNYGSFVTHESKTFIFFQIDTISILLFKTAKGEEDKK